MDTPIPVNARTQIAFTGATATPHLGHATMSIASPSPHARHETRLMLSPGAPSNPRSPSAARAAWLERTGSFEARERHENVMRRCATGWAAADSSGAGGQAAGPISRPFGMKFLAGMFGGG